MDESASAIDAARGSVGVPAPSGTRLLTAKLTPPPLGFPPLARPRLLRALSDGVGSSPVTLVSGPAGSGKTVLAASWALENPTRLPVAWLSLDAADDDPSTFWPYLLAALDRAGIAVPVGAPGDRPDAPVTAGWPVTLAAGLASMRQQVVLIIDNADHLTSRELTDALDLLVRHAGSRLRLVLCGRADPLLPLHRYRLDDRLTEIRTDQLAFDTEETGQLLASFGTPVSAEVAAELRRQTEGWAAALRLAVAPLARGVDPAHLVTALTADDGSVAEYLMAEVLDHQPATVRRFLLRISTTRELWPELVDALTGGPGGGHVLASLNAENAFVERAAGAPGGFRIHALFRELLQARLAYEDADAFTSCHRICADWYTVAKQRAVAVEHARAAGDQKLAAHLLIDDLAVGHILAHGTVDGPLRADTGGPDAAVLRAAAALAGQRPAASADLSAAAAAAADPHARPALRACAATVCAVAAAAGPVGDRVRSIAATAESLVVALPTATERRRAELTAVLSVSQATAMLALEVPERVLREAFARGLDAARTAGAHRLVARCLAQLALLEALVGRLRRATRLAGDYEALVDERRVPEADRSPAAAIAVAWVALDRHELAAARRWLSRAGGRAPDGRSCWSLCAVLESRLRRARGELVHPSEALRSVLDAAEPASWAREHVLTEAMRIHLAQRDGPAAEALLDRLAVDSPRRRVLHACAAAFQLVPAARTTEAGGPLALGLAVEDAVARACLLADAGAATTALATLGHALRLAEPERLRRPFLDAPPQLRPLLRTAHASLAADAAWLNPTAAAVPAPRHPAGAMAGPRVHEPPQAVIGELSPRELEVLQLLAEMLSTPEIAAALFVSVNTVRTHVRSILRKLDVTRRTEAVRRARELHLLERGGTGPGETDAATTMRA
jgi:LuxR family maltose regulon positive regulatory protein